MKKLLLILIMIAVVGVLAIPAGATGHRSEPAAVTTNDNGVVEIGNGLALAPATTSAKTIAYVADMFAAEQGRHVAALTGPIPD